MSGSRAALAAEDGQGNDGDDAERAAVEARAERMGWRPREKYRGPADKWVDADEYIEKGERMLPLLQERNRSQDRTIQSMQQQLTQQGETLATVLQATRKADLAGYKRARRELEMERAKAVAEADTATFNNVERQLQDLGPPPEAPVEPVPRPAAGAGNPRAPGAAANPIVDAWVRRNPWFKQSKAANAWAIGMLEDLETEDPDSSIEENLAEISRQARTTFPRLFPGARRPAADDDGAGGEGDDNSRRRAPPRVNGSGDVPPRRPGPRSFEAMPADVRNQFPRQAKMMEGKGDPLTKEEFARYYWESVEEAA